MQTTTAKIIAASVNTTWCGHSWAVDASELGMPPGQWPDAVLTTLGNERPFQRSHEMRAREGDFMGWRYVQPGSNLQLAVFND